MNTTTKTRPDSCPRCGENSEGWATTPNGVCDPCMDELHACLNAAADRWERQEYLSEMDAHRNYYKK